MTGEQLLAKLQAMTPEQLKLRVHTVYAYGDHCERNCAPSAMDISVLQVAHSDYLGDYQLAEEGEDAIVIGDGYY